MYNLSYFKAADQAEVIAFMKAHPFITLCGVGKDGFPVATHVPVLFEERDGKLFLLAHIMRKQNHTVAFENNPNVLAIFTGAHSYVSASWYPQQNVASTWNYQAIHAKGALTFLDEKGLHDLLVKLTDTFEGNPHSPAAVKNMDENYVTNLMKAIVAFEIEITDLQHVFKLSQNHKEQSYNNITEQLSSGTDEDKAVAAVMKDRKDKVFFR
ncbi:FMN-binding negative transcriptional regulator [Chitinophagaceae bacterium LWZ2-11]